MKMVENEITTRLKSLKRLENLMKGHKSIKENYTPGEVRAVRTKDGTYKTRTHNIDLKDNIVAYENSQSKWYFYEFETEKEAAAWWNKHIEPTFVKK